MTQIFRVRPYFRIGRYWTMSHYERSSCTFWYGKFDNTHIIGLLQVTLFSLRNILHALRWLRTNIAWCNMNESAYEFNAGILFFIDDIESRAAKLSTSTRRCCSRKFLTWFKQLIFRYMYVCKCPITIDHQALANMGRWRNDRQGQVGVLVETHRRYHREFGTLLTLSLVTS